jgi:hypothetical protein
MYSSFAHAWRCCGMDEYAVLALIVDIAWFAVSGLPFIRYVGQSFPIFRLTNQINVHVPVGVIEQSC